jgi:YHS domain-containing protein
MTHVSSLRVHGVTFDPVCGATLDLSEALGPVTYRGLRYHFCSHRCQSQFFAHPPQDLQREVRLNVAFDRVAIA